MKRLSLPKNLTAQLQLILTDESAAGAHIHHDKRRFTYLLNAFYYKKHKYRCQGNLSLFKLSSLPNIRKSVTLCQ